jgi:hypothetical protein
MAEAVLLINMLVIGFWLGLGLRPLADKLWKKLNDKLNEWADV